MDAADADPLRLSFCPACGYPLDGRPPAGRCPECGGGYDAGQPWVVLRGHQSFARVLTVIGTAPLPVIVVGLLWLDGRRAGMVAPALAGLSVCVISAHAAIWLANGWPNRFLLWLSPAGWGWRLTFDPGPLVRRLILAGLAAFTLGGIVWMARGLWHALLVAIHRSWGATATLLGLVGFYGAFLRAMRWLVVHLIYGRRGRPERRGGLRRLLRQPRLLGHPPPAIPWDRFGVVTLRPCRGGRHRFTAGRRGRWFVVPLIQMDVDLSPAAAAALADRLDAWRGNTP